jgi:hypothetical protein
MKEKKRSLTLPLRCYGIPTAGPMAASGCDVENTWQSAMIETDSASSKAKFNACQHTVMERVKYAHGFRQEIVPTNAYRVVATNDYIASLIKGEQDSVKKWPGGGPMDDPGFRALLNEGLVPDEQLKSFSLFGAKKILPQFKNEVSIINFLIELKDLPRMLRQLKSTVDYFLDRAKGKIDPKFVPNSVLAVEFGWLPFVSDIVNIARALGNFRKQLKLLIKDQHKIRISSVHRTVPSYFRQTDLAGSDIYVGPSIADGLPEMRAFLNSGSESIAVRNRRITFTIKYSYWVPDLTKSQVELRSLLQALGVEWNPKIIWDALPFTFLVDWVTDVGAWLESQFRLPTFEVSLRVHEFCISEKCSYSFERYGNVPTKWDPPDRNVGKQTYWYTSKGTYFRRRVNDFITREECLRLPWRGIRGNLSSRKLASFLSLIVTNAKAAKKAGPRNLRFAPGFVKALRNSMPRWWKDRKRSGSARRRGQGRRPRRVRH